MHLLNLLTQKCGELSKGLPPPISTLPREKPPTAMIWHDILSPIIIRIWSSLYPRKTRNLEYYGRIMCFSGLFALWFSVCISPRARFSCLQHRVGLLTAAPSRTQLGPSSQKSKRTHLESIGKWKQDVTCDNFNILLRLNTSWKHCGISALDLTWWYQQPLPTPTVPATHAPAVPPRDDHRGVDIITCHSRHKQISADLKKTWVIVDVYPFLLWYHDIVISENWSTNVWILLNSDHTELSWTYQNNMGLLLCGWTQRTWRNCDGPFPICWLQRTVLVSPGVSRPRSQDSRQDCAYFAGMTWVQETQSIPFQQHCLCIYPNLMKFIHLE